MTDLKTIAELNYNKLTEPKLTDLNTYINHWVWEEQVKIKVGTKVSQATSDSPDLMSRSLYQYLNHQYSSPIEQREIFSNIIKGRFNLAVSRGFNNYVEMIKKSYVIPNNLFKEFSQKTYTKISTEPCPICNSTFPPISFPDGIVQLVAQEYPIIRNYLPKIIIEQGSGNHTRYIKESDTIAVNIDKTLKENHKIVALFHELSHAIDFIIRFKQNIDTTSTGIYNAEEKAATYYLPLIKSYSPTAYQAYLENIDQTANKLLLEIKIYSDPQSIPTDEDWFLNDEHLIMKPLSALSQCIAISNLITTIKY